MSGYPKGDRFFCVLFGSDREWLQVAQDFIIYSQNIYNIFNIQLQLLLLNLFVCPNFAEEKHLKKLLSVVQNGNYFLSLFYVAQKMRETDIFDESVFIVLNRKCGSFHKQKDNEQHSFLVQLCGCTLSAYLPHTIQVWGIVSFIFAWVFPQPSIR